jgi:hypothetical protein
MNGHKNWDGDNVLVFLTHMEGKCSMRVIHCGLCEDGFKCVSPLVMDRKTSPSGVSSDILLKFDCLVSGWLGSCRFWPQELVGVDLVQCWFFIWVSTGTPGLQVPPSCL